MSLNNISILNNIVYDAHPCRQTVYLSLKKFYNRMKYNKWRNRVYSGNYGYDESYIKINGMKFYILALFDLKYNVLIDYKITDNLEKQTVKSFLEEVTKGHPRNFLTTDGRPMYKSIADDLGFVHNLCIFHLIKELNELVYKEMKNDKLDPNLKAQIFDDHKIILKILYQKDYRKAKNKFNKLLKKMDKIAPFLRDFINKKLKPDFERYMRHTQYKFLPSTNNAMENFFGVVFPKHLKKIYKTELGVTIYFDLQTSKWNTNHGLAKIDP
jgi:transposase-like protein